MALESGTFVSDLVSSNPPGTDPKNQGDDHLRLVKSVLQASFPNATKAFYFPGVQAKSANYTVLAADENDLFVVNASGATRTITLPTSPATGFIVSVSKDDASGNTVIVDGGGAETINGAATSVLTTRYQLETYQFNGTEWKIIGIYEVGVLPSAALGTAALVDTGTADANVPTNTNLKGTVREFTKQQNFNATTLSDGSSISWDLNSNQVAKVTLGGNRTLSNPTNLVDGSVYILRVIQDGSGSRTLAYGSAYDFPEGTAPVLSTAGNAVDVLTFVCDGSNMLGVIQQAFS